MAVGRMPGPVKRLGRFVAHVALGMLVGAALLTPWVAKKIQRLQLQVAAQRLEISQAQSEARNLQEQLSAARLRIAKPPTIQRIEIKVLSSDPADALELAKRMHTLLQGLQGVPLSHLDPALVERLLTDRVLFLGSRAYRLSLRLAVIAQTTQLLLAAQPL